MADHDGRLRFRYSHDAAAAALAAMAEPVAADLKEVVCPVLLVRGDRSHIFTAADAERAAASLPPLPDRDRSRRAHAALGLPGRDRGAGQEGFVSTHLPNVNQRTSAYTITPTSTTNQHADRHPQPSRRRCSTTRSAGSGGGYIGASPAAIRCASACASSAFTSAAATSVSTPRRSCDLGLAGAAVAQLDEVAHGARPPCHAESWLASCPAKRKKRLSGWGGMKSSGECVNMSRPVARIAAWAGVELIQQPLHPARAEDGARSATPRRQAPGLTSRAISGSTSTWNWIPYAERAVPEGLVGEGG